MLKSMTNVLILRVRFWSVIVPPSGLGTMILSLFPRFWFQDIFVFDRRCSVMARTSASQSVDLEFIPLFELTKRLLKMVSIASPLGDRHSKDVLENKPASSLVVFLGKALNGTPPSLCGRQVAQTPGK